MGEIKVIKKNLYCYWCGSLKEYLISVEGAVECKQCGRFINRKDIEFNR